MSAPAPNPQALLLGRSPLSGFTRLSKGLASLLVIGYLVSLIPSAHNAFALLPGNTIPYAWNVLTAGFFERHLITLLPNVAALLYLGRLLEPVWGTREFLRFVLITNVLTCVCTFILMVGCYYFTFQGYFLYEPISGFHGAIAGLLVAVKQLTPDQDITIVVIKFRAKWLPSLLVLLSTVLCVCIGHGHLFLPFILFGTYTSWAYLRFFQIKSDGALKGDPSDEFAFETFFPEAVRPLVGTIATVLFRLLCGRRSERNTAEMDEEEMLAAGKPLPGSDPQEASRRRERGARALEERLAKAAEAAAAAATGGGGGSAGAAAGSLPSKESSGSSGNLSDKV